MTKRKLLGLYRVDDSDGRLYQYFKGHGDPAPLSAEMTPLSLSDFVCMHKGVRVRIMQSTLELPATTDSLGSWLCVRNGISGKAESYYRLIGTTGERFADPDCLKWATAVEVCVGRYFIRDKSSEDDLYAAFVDFSNGLVLKGYSEIEVLKAMEDWVTGAVNTAHVYGYATDAYDELICASESRRIRRESQLRDLGFEDLSDEQRREMLARNIAMRDRPKD